VENLESNAATIGWLPPFSAWGSDISPRKAIFWLLDQLSLLESHGDAIGAGLDSKVAIISILQNSCSSKDPEKHEDQLKKEYEG
jgi:hypothetical protein